MVMGIIVVLVSAMRGNQRKFHAFISEEKVGGAVQINSMEDTSPPSLTASTDSEASAQVEEDGDKELEILAEFRLFRQAQL